MACPPAPALIEVVTLTDVAARGHKRILDGWGVGREFHDEAKKVQPGDLATIIYTSGTTGEPKGVMLTHANLVANMAGVNQVLDLNPGDTALSFLPLCHAFERMVAYIYMACGVSMIFAESIDTIARDLQQVKPTVMTGVPRVFEKLHARILTKGRDAGGVKRVIFDWADDGRRDARPAVARAPPLVAFTEDPVEAGRAARVRQDPAGSRRTLPVRRLGQRGASRRHRPFLLRARPADSGGLRPDGNRAGALRDADWRRALRDGRTSSAKRRAAHRARRRDPGSRAERHDGLPQPFRSHRRGDPRRLVPHGRHRRAGRGRVSGDHGPEEGADRHVGRQEDRAAAD